MLLWAIVLAILGAARDVLLPFILAALAAYVIDPLIARLTLRHVGGRRVPRPLAVIAVYLVLGAAAYVFAVSVVPQIYREAIRGLIELRDFLAGIGPEKVAAWAKSIDDFMQRYGIPVDVLPGTQRSGARIHVDLAAELAEALGDLSSQAGTELGDVVALSRALLTGTFKTLFFFITAWGFLEVFLKNADYILDPIMWNADYNHLSVRSAVSIILDRLKWDMSRI